MPLHPRNIDEERQLALARVLHQVVQVLLGAGAHPWGPESYLRGPQVRRDLRAADDVLYSYFLGD